MVITQEKKNLHFSHGVLASALGTHTFPRVVLVLIQNLGLRASQIAAVMMTSRFSTGLVNFLFGEKLDLISPVTRTALSTIILALGELAMGFLSKHLLLQTEIIFSFAPILEFAENCGLS